MMSHERFPVLEEQWNGTTTARRAAGRAVRNRVPRSSHAIWSPQVDRVDPIQMLEASNRSRIPALVPIRYGRMLTSPFAFLRGSAVIMAADLAVTPVSGIRVQICGDAHLSNFGTYATPERQQVFDVNDFDETLPGPWEWDVKRLATSIVVAARQNGYAASSITQAVFHCLRTYRERMWEFGDMGYLDIWYSSVDAQRILKQAKRSQRPFVTRELEKAHRHTNAKIFPQLTSKSQGHALIKDEPPSIFHLEENERADVVQTLMEGYEASLPDERRALFHRYRLVDLAQKVVGVGSVGTHCLVMLLQGREENDPLFLQIKEAQPSVLEPHLLRSIYPNQAQRVVNGQRLMQAASDLFLGWTTADSRDYYIRQLRDRKGTPTIEQLSELDFTLYVGLCGWALARAHARSGDPASISGYLGTGDQFDRAIVTFAHRYADQTVCDHAALVEAVRTGRVQAEQIA